jgi:shikimate kinase
MIFYLLGPSHIGKTTLGLFASKRIKNCEFFDLDKLVAQRNNVKHISDLPKKIGWDGFWRECKAVLEELDERYKNDDKVLCLVAIGAGALVSKEGQNYFKNCRNTITIYGFIEEVYIRNRLRTKRSYEEFKNSEYSKERMDVYKSSKFKFDISGLNKEQAGEVFVKFLLNILRNKRNIKNIDMNQE